MSWSWKGITTTSEFSLLPDAKVTPHSAKVKGCASPDPKKILSSSAVRFFSDRTLDFHSVLRWSGAWGKREKSVVAVQSVVVGVFLCSVFT